jgi:hypothetical protein
MTIDPRLAALHAIRDKLTAELAEAKGRDAATIAHELRAVHADIERLAPPRGSSRIDELAARRTRRVPNAKGVQRSKGDQPSAG